MTPRLAKLLETLQTPGREAASSLVAQSAWLRRATDEELRMLFSALADAADVNAYRDAARTGVLLAAVCERMRAARNAAARPLDDAMRGCVVRLYRQLGGPSAARHWLLLVLTLAGGAEDLRQFADLMAEDPPQGPHEATLPFVPLFQFPHYEASSLFPRLLEALAHRQAAAPVLDLCNFVARRGMVASHPAADRAAQLAQLLGELVQRLSRIESSSAADPVPLRDLQQQVAQATALIIPLCDALALIGDRQASGKLHQAMQLQHRRLRTEAAAALARLGEPAGVETLMAMAAEPSVRLHVLAYAEQLGLLDEVPREHRSPVAKAEAELTSWLAQPTRFGLPPQQCDLVDARQLAWPGYESPVDCWLFRFAYRLPRGEFAGTGIVGPLVRSLAADPGGLSVEDLYAAFAGWQAEHREITEAAADDLSDEAQAALRLLQQRLAAEGYRDVRPIKMGSFFGTAVLVASARREQTEGVVVADASQTRWFAGGGVTADDAYCIYKGWKLLEAFNPGFGRGD